ncbi:thioredoxin family protein [Orrella sp. JC864]|uniref:thioredoxin family protein n=1 Tax=Orrella sp. JC864 TaxID=3120298 RepID=UPI0012BC05FA
MSALSFDPTQVFEALAMQPVDSEGFDAAVVEGGGDTLHCVFLWGKDCYNCNLFKQAALLHQQALRQLDLKWFQADVYQDVALGRRFALHGVPTFVFYRRGKRLGRITGWPGLPQFQAAVAKLQAEA